MIEISIKKYAQKLDNEKLILIIDLIKSYFAGLILFVGGLLFPGFNFTNVVNRKLINYKMC